MGQLCPKLAVLFSWENNPILLSEKKSTILPSLTTNSPEALAAKLVRANAVSSSAPRYDCHFPKGRRNALRTRCTHRESNGPSPIWHPRYFRLL